MHRQHLHREPSGPRQDVGRPRTVAEQMQPQFAKLKGYYVGMTGRMGPRPGGAPGQHRLQLGRHPGELFADVLPHQHAAAAQQQQPHDGLRGDDLHRVEARGQMAGRPLRTESPASAAQGSDTRKPMDRRQFSRRAGRRLRSRAAVLAKEPIYIGDMHLHLSSSAWAIAATSPLGPDHGGRQRDARRLVAGRRRAVAAITSHGIKQKGLPKRGRGARLVRERAGAHQEAHRRSEP